MLNVQEVLRHIPHFEKFCSVEQLHGLVERLDTDARFYVAIAGTSVNGVPIHHVCLNRGRGRLKALVVGGPNAMEPIGSLTVFALMTLLQQRNRALLEADIEWHIVPCIDPDGALLNEGWSQKPFTLDNYLRNFYLPPNRDMVDCSFPVVHKRLVWNQPSKEASILKELLDSILPDFYYALHHSWIGGACYFLSRDIDRNYHRQLHELLRQHEFPIQRRSMWKGFSAQFGEGIVEMVDVTKHYDYVEKTTSCPETVVQYGAGSCDYLTKIKPSALTLVTEMGHVRHASDESENDTGQNLRKFQLRVDAGSKFLATVMLEEWEKVKEEVDAASP